MLTLLLVAGGLTLGYLTGRIRPARRASSWAWRHSDYRRVTRTSWRWWVAQPVFACEIAVLFATRPRQTFRSWQSWRTRDVPPPGLVPGRRNTPLGEP